MEYLWIHTFDLTSRACLNVYIISKILIGSLPEQYTSSGLSHVHRNA